MLRPGIYVQSCSIGRNDVSTGNEVTVDYGLDYCEFSYVICDWTDAVVGPGNAEWYVAVYRCTTSTSVGVRPNSTTQMHRSPELPLDL